MTKLFITIDTEYEFGFTARAGMNSRAENFARSIACETPSGPKDSSVGIDYQMDVFDRHGLKAVFFVDPMPAMLWGVESISDVVGPIIERGHDVQLHIHTEWLAMAQENHPLSGRSKGKIGRNIKDFTFDEQCALIDYARGVLIAAGAPNPCAFRAGNYGANDQTLMALADLGFTHDTSHAPALMGGDCAITLGAEDRAPIELYGLTEVPISCIARPFSGLRHAQLTALSCFEMLAALRHARAKDIADFTLVSHSFEILSRDRSMVNCVVQRRFEKLCRSVSEMQDVTTGTYAEAPPQVNKTRRKPRAVLPASEVRTGMRIAEQALANALYAGTRTQGV